MENSGQESLTSVYLERQLLQTRFQDLEVYRSLITLTELLWTVCLAVTVALVALLVLMSVTVAFSWPFFALSWLYAASPNTPRLDLIHMRLLLAICP